MSVDLLGISSSAVAAYQRALGTVSNNIANVGTEGYSRQTSNLVESSPIKQGNTYFGSGALYESVKRSFDVFAESNLRNSNTDLATQTPLVEYSQRVMDIMGDKSIGLSSALDDFFTSARNLSVDPASVIQRTSFVTASQGLGSRFSELCGQLKLVQDETHQAMESNAQQVNILTEQLALVNQQLTRSPTLLGQPAELLDKRDLLLRQLSEFSRIKTEFTPSGVVSVSLSDSMKQSVVVNGIKSYPIGFSPDGLNKNDLLLDPYGQSVPLAGASGGTMGGLNSFISQVLEPAKKGLDFLAKTFVDQVNAIHQSGIDGYGDVGTALFKIDPTASQPAAGLKLLVTDPMRISTGGLFRISQGINNPGETTADIHFDGSVAPDTIMSNPNLQNNPFTNNPLMVNIVGTSKEAFVTSIAAGASSPVIYLDNMEPGQNLQLLTKDGRHLLGQTLTEDQKYQILSTQNGFSPELTYSDAYLNLSGTRAYKNMDVFYGAKGSPLLEQQFDPFGNPAPSTLIPATLNTSRINPILATHDMDVVPKGALTLNGGALGALSLKQGEVLSPQNIADWLNAGIDANPQFSSDQATLSYPISTQSSVIQLKNADALPDEGGVIKIGEEVIYYSGKAVDLAGNKNILTGVIRGLSYDQEGVKYSDPAKIANHTVDQPVQINDMLHAQVFNQVRVASKSINPQEELQINGVVIGSRAPGNALPTQYHDIKSLVQAIQVNTPKTGVTARIASNGDLVLENLPGHEGDAIKLGPANAEGKPANAFSMNLSPVNSTLYGMVRLTRRLGAPDQSDIRLSFGEFGPVDKRQMGSPFDLSQVGFRTGAYIKGQVPDDVQVFVTGTGKADIAAGFSGTPLDPSTNLRNQNLQIKFTAADRYVIVDTKTGTELADAHYDTSILQPEVNFQGLQIKFSAAPKVGEVFNIDGNHDGLGNNQNMMVMAELAKKQVTGSKTLSETYINQVNDVGNTAQQAKITQQALTVVNDQAKSSRDKVSGVNLDDEAADLIRFQQAYQAAAKSLQVSGQLFDAIVQIR